MPSTLISLDEASWRLEQSTISGQICAELLLKSEPLLFGLSPGNELHDRLDLSRVTSFRAEAENVVIADNVRWTEIKLNWSELGDALERRGVRVSRCWLLLPWLHGRRGELGRNGLKARYSPAPYPRRGNHREGNAARSRVNAG